MKRYLSLILALALALALPGTVSAYSSPSCGAYPQLNAYADNNYVRLLGVSCPQFTTDGFDVNWGDTRDAFQVGDNNAMNSFRIWNPTNQTWCLVFWDGTTINSPYLWYIINPLGNAWVGPLGGNVGDFNDRTSRVEYYVQPAGGCNP